MKKLLVLTVLLVLASMSGMSLFAQAQIAHVPVTQVPELEQTLWESILPMSPLQRASEPDGCTLICPDGRTWDGPNCEILVDLYDLLCG